MAAHDEHTRPDGASDAAVRASGLMSEALERIERARGAMYDAHQLIGSADSALDDVIEALAESGNTATAAALKRELVGLDVIEGRWTFQLMEEFDDGFYARWREWEQRIRDECVGGRRHVLEAEMKAERQT
jgi:hypothetical protein